MTENSSNLKKQGMTVREYVGENKSSYLIIKYKMNNTDEKTYIEMFHELKRTGTLINDSYDDDLWICFEDKDSPTRRLSFSFLKAHPQMEKTVKNYLLVNMGEKVIEKELLGTSYYELPKVAKGQGRCSSQNIPYDCNHKSCLFCKYFFPENVSEDLLTYYKEENDRNMAFVKKSLQSLIGQIVIISRKSNLNG